MTNHFLGRKSQIVLVSRVTTTETTTTTPVTKSVTRLIETIMTLANDFLSWVNKVGYPT